MLAMAVLTDAQDQQQQRDKRAPVLGLLNGILGGGHGKFEWNYLFLTIELIVTFLKVMVGMDMAVTAVTEATAATEAITEGIIEWINWIIAIHLNNFDL